MNSHDKKKVQRDTSYADADINCISMNGNLNENIAPTQVGKMDFIISCIICRSNYVVLFHSKTAYINRLIFPYFVLETKVLIFPIAFE